jgi:hypothetical protein
LGLVGDKITSGFPEVCVHIPVPTTGVFPFSSIGTSEQYEVTVAETSAEVGNAELTTVTSSYEEQKAVAEVHRKT